MSYAVANQAQKNADLIFKSYRQQMLEVVVNHLRMRIKQKEPITEAFLAPYKALLKRSTHDTPYAHFFQNLKRVESIEALKAYQQYIIDTLTQNGKYLDFLRTGLKIITEKTNKIIIRAEENKKRLASCVTSRNHPNDQTAHSQREVEVQIQQEQEIIKEQTVDLEQEFQSYQIRLSEPRAKHIQWWDTSKPQNSIRALIDAIQ